MKFQAFVEFPSIELATIALKKTHGLLVQGKPLIVVRVTLNLFLYLSLTEFTVNSASVNPLHQHQ